MPETLTVPDEAYGLTVPDEAYGLQVPDEAYGPTVPDSAYGEPVDSPNVAGAKAAWESLNKPGFGVPEGLTREEVKTAYPFLNDKTADVLAGVDAAAKDLAGGLTSPLGLATMGLGTAARAGFKLAKAGATAGAAYFGYEAAKSLPQQVVTAEEAFKAGDVVAGTRAAVGAAASAVIAPSIAGHIAAPLAKPAPLVPFVERTSRAMGETAKATTTEADAVAPKTAEAISEGQIAVKSTPAPPLIAEDMGAVLIDANEMAKAKVEGLQGFTDAERDVMRVKLEEWVREEAEKFQAKNGTLDGFLPEVVIKSRVNTAIDFVQAEKRGGGTAKVELDKPTEEGGTVGEAVAGGEATPAEALQRKEVMSAWDRAVAALSPDEQAQVQAAVASGNPKLSQTLSEKLHELLIGEGVDSEALVGMGAAIPSEFFNRLVSPTSIKNAKVDVERESRGLPPAVQPARRSFGEVWDQATAKIDQDPTYQDRLINELRDKPRALTDLEDATLLQRQVDLQNEHAKATRDLAQAFDDGRLEDVEVQKARVAELSDRLLDLYNIGKRVGTETGRGLSARRMMANEDFTLAALEMQKRAAKGGAPLTDAERTELTKLANDFQTKNAALEKLLADKDERIATIEAQQALAKIQAEAAKTTASPYVISVAEKIVAGLEKRADAARVRLREKMGRTSVGVDPTILADLAEIGAAHIGRVGLEFGRWSIEMAKDVGEWVKPHLEDVFKASQKLVDNVTQTPGVRRVVKKEGASEQADAIQSIKVKVEAGEGNDITAQVQKIARGFVEAGVKDRDALIDAVHAELQKVMPEITRRETMDAISGYGRFKQLTKDQISVELRDLKGQMQQIGKLEDMQAGEAPKKTGVERRVPSDEERRLIKQVEEAKKKGGYTVTDPATQLRSALQATQRRLENQIADLEHEIETQSRIVKAKTKGPTSPEVEALRTKRDALKAERDQILKDIQENDPLYQAEVEAHKLNAQRDALLKSIAEKERRLQEGDLAGPGRPVNRPADPVLETLRQQRDALTAKIAEARDAAKPKKTPEEIALQAFKTRVANQIATLQEKLAKGDFSTKPKRQIQLDPEATTLKFELEQIKRKYAIGLERDRLAQRTLLQKAFEGTFKTARLMRDIMTSGEFSVILKQGAFGMFSRPIRTSKAIADLFRSFRSEKGDFAVNEKIKARENYQAYQRSGLHLYEIGDKLSKMDEAVMSEWAARIPVLKAFQRSFSTFLNVVRADAFDALEATVARGRKLTPFEGKLAANFINANTGRGSLAARETVLVGLNTWFFAPRYWLSRLQVLSLQPIWHKVSAKESAPAMRKAIAMEYARALIGIGTVMTLAKMGGATVDTDPKSTNYRKIVLPSGTTIDLFAGLLQNTVFFSRIAAGEKTTQRGRTVPIRRTTEKRLPYGTSDAAGVTGQFLRTKLAPIPATGLDLASGSDVMGNLVTPASAAANLVTPMTWGDIYQIMKLEGIPSDLALVLLSMAGGGVRAPVER